MKFKHVLITCLIIKIYLFKNPSKIVHHSAFLLLHSDYLFSCINACLWWNFRNGYLCWRNFFTLFLRFSSVFKDTIFLAPNRIKFSFFFLPFYYMFWDYWVKFFLTETVDLLSILYNFINIYPEPEDYPFFFCVFSFVYKGKKWKLFSSFAGDMISFLLNKIKSKNTSKFSRISIRLDFP